VSRRVVPWLPVLLLALGLFWASGQSNLRFAQDETEDFLVRKAGHVAVYAVGTLLLWRAIALTTRLRPAWAWAAGIATAFAASDELHQVFTRGREPTIRDVAIDAIGIVAAVLIGRAVRRGELAD
jgi:VanZ family protein